MSTDDELVPRDFVCTGLRRGVGVKHVLGLAVLSEDGKEIERTIYIKAPRRSYTIGGVYRGASFSKNGTSRVPHALLMNHWHNEIDVATWQGEEAATLEAEAYKKAERTATPELVRVLMPYTVAYQRCTNYESRRGMEIAVLEVLKHGRLP